ncbi:ECF transporter S component [Glycomyces sp. L485]|uniref:ECF transporter S component n=1 Tax=Glycomyces sp. L485 TaxID=2909235 RepID=UPI001F4BB469|nr:ECF transporter S component [Glycomyces sp. L485]MCH7229810.1 ECF transporter S component [Glycomyces sp. L485]
MPTTDSLTSTARWRTLDIVTCAVIAVAFGIVFWAWNFLWAALEAPFSFYPPLRAVIYGVWLIPAVLAPLIVRRPGAAVFTEGLAAVISAFLGSFWGIMVVYQGLVQGLGGELAFASGRYRRFGTGTAMLAGAMATFAATVFDAFAWYPHADWLTFRLPFIAIATVSGAIIAGLGSKALVGAMQPTGVLDRFPAGRERRRI